MIPYFFLVESIFIESVIFLVLSAMAFVESRAVVIELSDLTVVESVVELEEFDPQAARMPTSVTVNSFFI